MTLREAVQLQRRVARAGRACLVAEVQAATPGGYAVDLVDRCRGCALVLRDGAVAWRAVQLLAGGLPRCRWRCP